MTVLAFDLSRKCTGLAAWGAEMSRTKPRWFTIELPKHDDIGVITNEFEKLLMPIHQMIGATQWIYENPIIVPHRTEEQKAEGAQPHINVIEIERTLGLSVMMRHLARKADVPCDRTYRGTVAKHFTGKGNGTTKELKARHILHCQLKGWQITDDNLADATAVLDWWLWETTKGVGVPWDCSPYVGGLFEKKPPETKHLREF